MTLDNRVKSPWHALSLREIHDWIEANDAEAEVAELIDPDYLIHTMDEWQTICSWRVDELRDLMERYFDLEDSWTPTNTTTDGETTTSNDG